MKYFLLLFTCLFALNIASAQCDKYDALMKEGGMLYEKQQYRAALKKFNAARTCGGDSKSAEVERAVDKLFAAIEAQKDEANAAQYREKEARAKAEGAEGQAQEERKRADLERNKALEALELANKMRDSIFLEIRQRQRAELLIASNDLQRLGDIAFAEKNYKKSLGYYALAIQTIQKYALKDSVLFRKIELLQIDTSNAITQINKQKEFDFYFKAGDSLSRISITFYADAYVSYFKAFAAQYDSFQVKERLKYLEATIGPKIKIQKNLKGEAFYKLCSESNKANILLNNPTLADKRIKQANRLHNRGIFLEFDGKERKLVYLNYYFGIKNYAPNLSKNAPVAVKTNNKYVNRFATYSLTSFGVGFNFNNWGFIYESNKRNRVKIGDRFNPNNTPDPTKHRVSYLFGPDNQKEHAFLATYDLIKRNNKRWGSPIFKLEAIVGLSVIKFEYSSVAYLFFREVNEVPESIQSTYGFYAYDGFGHKAYINTDFENVLINWQSDLSNVTNSDVHDFDIHKFNVTKKKHYYPRVGLRANYHPIARFPRLALYGEISTNLRLSKERSYAFNLGKEVFSQLESSGLDSDASKFLLETYNVDIKVDPSFSRFYTGLNLSFGVGCPL